MSALFISDLHLENPHSSRFQTFHNLIIDSARKKQAVYILGDLTEVWVGDDDDSDLSDHLRRVLRECASSTNVYLFHGNRDFLYGSKFELDTGVEILNDPTVIELDEFRVLLTHGDTYCTDDVAYQNMRSMLRSPEAIDHLNRQSLEERRTLASTLRAQSKAANALKPSNIMDVNSEALNADASKHRCDIMIHGHTHRPGIHEETWGTRFVLGQWNNCGWFLHYKDAGFNLQCIPLTVD